MQKHLYLTLALLAGCAAAPAPAPECPAVTVTAAPASTAPAARAETYPVVPYDFPRAEDFGTLESVLVVELTSAGALSLDRKPVAESQVIELTRAAHARNPGLRVVIHADGKTPWERVIRVMDLVKQGGVSRIAFGVAPVSP